MMGGPAAPHPIYVVSRIISTSSRRRTVNTDMTETQKRVRQCGELYFTVRTMLSGITKRKLLEIAALIASMYNVPGVDRVARRNKDALICWWCKNYS
jgi:hypothetical protein